MLRVFMIIILKLLILFLILFLTRSKNPENGEEIGVLDPFYLISRPTVYSGIQTTTETPIFFGMVYHNHDEERGGFIRLRERVNYHDRLNFKVIRSEPTKFCELSIHDTIHNDLRLDLKWIKPRNDSFVYRIEGDIEQSSECRRSSNQYEYDDNYISVFFYIGLTEGEVTFVNRTTIEGVSSNFGRFRLSSLGDDPNDSFFLSTFNEQPFYATDLLQDLLIHGVDEEGNPSCCYPLNHDRYLPNMKMRTTKKSNFAILQKVMKTPFSWSVKFEKIDSPLTSTELEFDRIFNEEVISFENHFDETFPISDTILRNTNNENESNPIRPSEWRELGLRIISGLLNGLSFFQGRSFVKDPNSGETWTLLNRSLLSFIPGKIGFPRSFYWDEGFHQMPLVRFHPKLHEMITNSWYDLMNDTTGWIAREQIIGEEALATSPQWAWPGLIDQMNPPSFFLATEQYYRKNIGSESVRSFISTLFWRFEKVFQWYHSHCQREPFTYGWNGRKWSGDSSFDSGLDDFPRFFKFSESEKNVDLQSWMIKVASLLAEWSRDVMDDQKYDYYQNMVNQMKTRLKEDFWNENLEYYVDIQTENGNIIKNDQIGTPGILPFCLQIEDDHYRILKIISKMNDTNEMYTDYGLMSLSRSSKQFHRTGDYWRGNIWLNINYLCLGALKYYESLGYVEAKDLRERLEVGIAKNMFRNYFDRGVMESGIYETFHPESGKGYNHLPFVGWSSLALLIISEDY